MSGYFGDKAGLAPPSGDIAIGAKANKGALNEGFRSFNRGDFRAQLGVSQRAMPPISSPIFAKENYVTMPLRRAGKLDSDSCGENALELQPRLFDRRDTLGFIIEADDRVGVDIFRPADKFAQNEFTPIVLAWCAVRGVPSGGGLYHTDRIENAAALDYVG
jgi:hypothetical protein